jgi:ornithine cyclodeaminase/alanine dehydrogenase
VDEVITETGDMLAAARDGIEFEGKIVSLNEFASQAKPHGAAKPSIPLFKSVGSALQDLAVAELVFDKARHEGLATQLPISFLTKGRGLREKA